MNASPRIPRTVWILGFVSLLMDSSSELVHSLLPILLVTNLGASALTLGVIEGFAEATALVSKIFSGALSDWLGRRKPLILLGYGLAALTKPLFPLATCAETVFTARIIDRIGKGIRGAPRDALIADVSPPAIRGACFGLRQSMDTVGAVIGPVLAVVLMLALSGRITAVLWFAVIPAVLSFLLIVVGVGEPPDKSPRLRFRSPIRWEAIRSFSGIFWWIVAIGAVFTMARFSEAFLVLRAQHAGLTTAWVPAVMVVMSVTYALSAYPIGALSDRIGRRAMLTAGIFLLLAADVILATASSAALVFVGVGLWGLHLGFTQGIFAAWIADETAQDLKATGFGLFNLASGIVMLLASVLAGMLWQWRGPASTFYAGAAFATGAFILSLFTPPRRNAN